MEPRGVSLFSMGAPWNLSILYAYRALKNLPIVYKDIGIGEIPRFLYKPGVFLLSAVLEVFLFCLENPGSPFTLRKGP